MHELRRAGRPGHLYAVRCMPRRCASAAAQGRTGRAPCAVHRTPRRCASAGFRSAHRRGVRRTAQGALLVLPCAAWMLTPADLHSNSQQCACMKTPNRNRDSGRRLPCMSFQGRTTDGLTGQDHTRKAIIARAAEPAAHLLQPAVRRLGEHIGLLHTQCTRHGSASARKCSTGSVAVPGLAPNALAAGMQPGTWGRRALHTRRVASVARESSAPHTSYGGIPLRGPQCPACAGNMLWRHVRMQMRPEQWLCAACRACKKPERELQWDTGRARGARQRPWTPRGRPAALSPDD